GVVPPGADQSMRLWSSVRMCLPNARDLIQHRVPDATQFFLPFAGPRHLLEGVHVRVELVVVDRLRECFPELPAVDSTAAKHIDDIGPFVAPALRDDVEGSRAGHRDLVAEV